MVKTCQLDKIIQIYHKTNSSKTKPGHIILYISIDSIINLAADMLSIFICAL